MPTTLERRIEALEARSTAVDTPPAAIVLNSVNPGHIGSPRVRAEFYGQTLHRDEGEAEDDFQDRAAIAAKLAAPAGQIAILCMFGAESRTQWAETPGSLVAVPADPQH